MKNRAPRRGQKHARVREGTLGGQQKIKVPHNQNTELLARARMALTQRARVSMQFDWVKGTFSCVENRD